MDCGVGSFSQPKEFLNVIPYTLAVTIPYDNPLVSQIR